MHRFPNQLFGLTHDPLCTPMLVLSVIEQQVWNDLVCCSAGSR